MEKNADGLHCDKVDTLIGATCVSHCLEKMT